jgi:hypothetical protein
MASWAAVCGLGVDEQEVNASKAAGITIMAASFNIFVFIGLSPLGVWFYFRNRKGALSFWMLQPESGEATPHPAMVVVRDASRGGGCNFCFYAV